MVGCFREIAILVLESAQSRAGEILDFDPGGSCPYRSLEKKIAARGADREKRMEQHL